MNDKLINRLEEIGHSLSKKEHALALLALGSSGVERERMDEYSDLDFFVICEDGYKEQFINNLDYLESIKSISYKFKNTKDGYKLLFDDNIFCEFAVFEIDELKQIEYSKGQIIWSKQEITISLENIIYIKQKTDVDFLIGEALTNLYVGLGRYHRGEKLSAYYFIQNYSFSRVLELMTILEKPQNSNEDTFSISRRFESRYPNNARLISKMLLGYEYTLIAAEEILNFLGTNFTINKYIKKQIIELIKKK